MPAQKPKKSVQAAAKSKPAAKAAPKTTAKAAPAKKPASKAVAAPANKAAAKAPAKAAAPAKPVKKAAPVPAKKTASKATESEKTTTSKAKAEQAEADVKKTAKKAAAEAEEAPAKKTAAKKAAADKPAKPAAKGAKRGPKKKDKSADEGMDEDLGDIEAELEGEPEPAAAPGEKVKPLRMKISKAKERALMKEFGLDETVLTEEEMNKRRQRLKTLIKLGKTRGYLTHAEINDHLPDKLVDAETLEVVIATLNDLGVAVYEQTPDAETLIITDNAPTGSTEEEAEEAAEAALSTVDSEFGRTTDPVRMYMREMGTGGAADPRR